MRDEILQSESRNVSRDRFRMNAKTVQGEPHGTEGKSGQVIWCLPRQSIDRRSSVTTGCGDPAGQNPDQRGRHAGQTEPEAISGGG